MILIGDPHLGRGFKTGVPLHRRGEREAKQMAYYRSLVLQTGRKVMVGDLFDSPQVGRDVVAFAIDVARDACGRGEQVYMAGNHDRSRQPGVVSSWDLFARGVRNLPEVFLVETPRVIDGVLYLPWEWGRSALEQLEDFDPEGAKTAVCHHDLESFGGNTSHMLPATRLAELGIEKIYTGHWHLPGIYKVDGIEVECTGSMLPYSHAEDPGELTYVTRRIEDLEPELMKDKVVRLVAPRGADIPEFDCLALTVIWEDEDTEEVLSQAMDTFNLQARLSEAFTKYNVPTDVRIAIEERL